MHALIISTVTRMHLSLVLRLTFSTLTRPALASYGTMATQHMFDGRPTDLLYVRVCGDLRITPIRPHTRTVHIPPNYFKGSRGNYVVSRYFRCTPSSDMFVERFWIGQI